MTIPVRVIYIFVTILILGFSVAKITKAEYFFRPIPDNIFNNQQSHLSGIPPVAGLTTDNLQLISTSSSELVFIDDRPNSKPSITFGDILNATSSSSLANLINLQLTTNNSQLTDISSRSAQIRELLTRLENSYKESQQNNGAAKQLNDQAIEQSSNSTSPLNLQQTANDQRPTTVSPSPTPYIPIPTLIAGISNIINSQQATDNRQQITGNNNLQTNNYQLPSPSPYPTINYPPPTAKSIYSIALLGDSMIDTLGRDLPVLRKLLKESFPSKNFALFNYGFGSTDLESGLFRLTHVTTYMDKTYAPILSFKPDILVVESFAYNHWSSESFDLDRQWMTLVKILDTVKENSPDTQIVLSSTIAPNAEIFGDGVLNWNSDLKWLSANTTKLYLQNMANFATASRLPYADAYHPSLGQGGNGLKYYINSGDHLHPSPEGALFFLQKVVDTIKSNQLIK